MSFAVVGPGRAGQSFTKALVERGWTQRGSFGRGEEIARLADDVDVVLLTVPDDAIAGTAAAIRPGKAAVLHVSGAKGLDVLEPHIGRGSVHPLTSLPDVDTGARRLGSGLVFAVAGDQAATEVVRALGGRPVTVNDESRALYHATAAIAANHLVALCAQVERLADEVGVPLDAYWALMATTLDNVRRSGPAATLTGPAARGDNSTLTLHLDALPVRERNLYSTLAAEAARLAGREGPSVLHR